MASRVGERLTLDVGAIAHGGHCVSRHDGVVVFVRHSLPGEQVVAEVTRGKEGDRFLFADAVEILAASPERVSPPCRYAGPKGCGGCDFQHVAVAEQRRLKATVVHEQLERLAGLDMPVTVLPVPVGGGDGQHDGQHDDGLRWRTRVELAVGRDGRPGLHPFHSHAVLPIDDCLIADEGLGRTGVLRRRFPKAKAVDVVLSSTGERAVIEVPHGLPRTPTIHEHVTVPEIGFDAEFRLNARGFWQGHKGAAAVFVRDVLSGLDPRPGDRCLDLYAGAGLFARALADAVGEDGAVLAVETDARAVASAEEWARGRPEVEVRQERVDDALAPLVEGGDVVDLVVLDPPRAGAGAEVMRGILALAPRAIAYVACDPASLARDLADALAGGYEVGRLTAYDAFPMTHHVECVAILERRATDDQDQGHDSTS